MNSYRDKESGSLVVAVQFEGSNQIFPDLKLKSWPDEHAIQPRDMSWGYIEMQAGRKNIFIGDWIVKNQAGSIILYRNGGFQSQFELHPPQGGSALSHQHQYSIACSDLVIVRWCATCGITDRVVRYHAQGTFPTEWTRIHEASNG